MNLEDVIDPEYGLQQDEWSLSKPVFGDEGQLEVVGWSGRCGSHKFYVLKCNKCSKDSDLFGQGYFKSKKSNIIRYLPCGCGKKTRWTKDQYLILCSRTSVRLGYKFLGFKGQWLGHATKVRLVCDDHGEWSTGIIDTLVNRCVGCPYCKIERDEQSGVFVKTPDEEMIDSFFTFGYFHPDTKFWRSTRENSRGARPYWWVHCPECDRQVEVSYTSLKRGSISCNCTTHRQKEAYINTVEDDANLICIKFGIAKNSKQRAARQNLKSAYEVKQYACYKFPDVASCKAAERECKQTLECGVVLKRDMPDGWTETTWLYNLEKIKAIYEKHGGVIKHED